MFACSCTGIWKSLKKSGCVEVVSSAMTNNGALSVFLRTLELDLLLLVRIVLLPLPLLLLLPPLLVLLLLGGGLLGLCWAGLRF